MNAEHDCFCELAPLYVLDLLDEPERHWVEQQITKCPDLAIELAEYEAAVTAIPYGTPATRISNTLKHRLFDRLQLDAPDESPIPVPLTPSYFSIRSHELDWQPHPIAAGVQIAIVHTDLQKREIAGLLQAEPGVRYPRHRHAAIEEIFMLAGDLIVGEAVYGTGDYIRSLPGSEHDPHTIGGCKFFFRTSMDDQY